MTRAVIVSDMLQCFLEEGYPLYCGASSRRIIPNVQKLLEQELAKGSKIFYLCDNHTEDDPEFAMFPHMPSRAQRRPRLSRSLPGIRAR